MPTQLTPEQENLARELVQLSHEDMLDDEFTFFETFGGSYLQLHKASRQIQCAERDINALRDAGLLRASFEGQNTAICSLRPEAADAVRRDFGGSRRRRVLNAIYDLSGGKPLHGILEGDIARRAKLSIEDLRAVYYVLANEKKVGGNSGGGNGPVMYLEAAGVRAVEQEDTPRIAPVIGGTFINSLNVRGDGSAIGIGAGASAIAHNQPHGITSLAQLREQNERMLVQHEAIRVALEDLTSAVSDGRSRDSATWTEKVTKLMEAGKSYVEFGTALMNTITPFLPK